MTENIVYGIHAVKSLLTQKHRVTKLVYINQDRLDKRMQEIITLAEKRAIKIEYLKESTLEQKFKDIVHQGVIAEASPLRSYTEYDIVELLEQKSGNALILILDLVTDPHNLGACLRSADGAGVDFVIIPKDKSVGITPVVTKVACGAAESVPLIKVTNLARTMDLLKQHGIWIYGATDEASASLYQLDLKSSIALVLGAEGEGMRRLTKERCDGLFSIPMYGIVSSLNVSVATGVSLYEAVRQRCL